MQPSDSRMYARFDLRTEAMLEEEGSDIPQPVFVVDIGLGGVQLRSNQDLPTGKRLVLKIGKKGQPVVEFFGIIRYSSKTGDGKDFIGGFKFETATHAERAQIAEFVYSVFQRQWEIMAS